MEIRIINKAHEADINIPNNPFPLRGRMIVTRDETGWHHREELLPPEKVTEMVFPDENYNFDEMPDSIFLGAYEDDKCVGLSILTPDFNPCLFLYDLKVDRSVRGKGVGRMLIEASLKIALEKNYKGLYTTGQDNNLNACLFYLACGFEIGGLDTAIYEGTKQSGKYDIFFYKRLPCEGKSK